MLKRIKSRHNYFEVCIGIGPNEDPANDTWICIKANPIIMPSNQILTKFLQQDLEKRPGTKVLGFFAIEEQEARACYDFSNETNWPILGGDIKTNLFDL